MVLGRGEMKSRNKIVNGISMTDTLASHARSNKSQRHRIKGWRATGHDDLKICNKPQYILMGRSGCNSTRGSLVIIADIIQRIAKAWILDWVPCVIARLLFFASSHTWILHILFRKRRALHRSLELRGLPSAPVFIHLVSISSERFEKIPAHSPSIKYCVHVPLL